MTEIHVTERAMFKRCRRRWKYQNVWEIVPKDEAQGALWIGTGIHYGLAEFYRSGKRTHPWDACMDWLNAKMPEWHLDQMWPEERQAFNANVELMCTMLSGYAQFSQQEDDFEVIAVEEPLSVHVPGTRTRLVGQLDLLVRRKNLLWDGDHKTVSQYANVEALEMDDQMTAYLWLVWQSHGVMPGGAMYNQLRKKVPAQPEMLMSGGLSKKKNVDTTYEIYLKAIKDNGLRESDYRDILEFLKNKPDGFYKREYVARTRYELEHFAENLTQEARAMNSRLTALYPSPTRDCVWDCQYRELCLCETTGGDVQGLVEANYEHAEGGRRQL